MSIDTLRTHLVMKAAGLSSRRHEVFTMSSILVYSELA